MALFPQQNFTFGGLNDRTHTNLVRSEGMSPAEQWILDPDLPGLFEYRFGGFGYVVIPKGKIVAVTNPKYDWETERVVNCLTLANGTNIPVGVAPYNFYEKRKDRMGHNQVSIINREYIEVPFIIGDTQVSEMKWGCATAPAATDIQAGMFVKPDARGNFVQWNNNKPMTHTVTAGEAGQATIYLKEPIKAGTKVYKAGTGGAADTEITAHVVSFAAGIVDGDAGSANLAKDDVIKYTSAFSDPIEQQVGQVLAVETDLPPLGWLAYFLDLRQEDDELNNAIKQASYPPAAEGGYPAYGYKNDYVAMMKRMFDAKSPTGIPFLTDGYFRAKKVYGGNNTPVAITPLSTAQFSNLPAARCAIAANGELTVQPIATDPRDIQLYLKMKAPLAVDGDVLSYDKGFTGIKIYFDNTQVREGVKYHVDYKNQTIVLLLEEADHGKTVTITCALIEDQIPGLPTEWDYQGSVGAVRILLCK